MRRFNPTLTAISKAIKANWSGSSKNKASKAAAQALEAVPPTNGDAYDYESRLVAKAKDQVENPAYFSAELKFAAVIGVVGLALMSVPVIFGITGGTLLVAALGLVMAGHAVDEIFLKDVPAFIDDTIHTEAVAQLKESGEADRKPIGLLGSTVIMTMCGLEGYMSADSVVAILGETRMTPAMVKTISFGLTILLAYGLYKAMLAAAHEKRGNNERRVIRFLENTDKAKADARKLHLGDALNHQYAPMHESSKKQYQFWGLFFAVMVLSLGLRVGFLLMPHNDDTANTPTSSEQMIFKKPFSPTTI